jgi:hypothetical protein
MQVSLKKAYEYEKAAFAAIAKVSISGNIIISIYNKLDVASLIREARAKAEQSVVDIHDLVVAGNTLHTMRSTINNDCGINRLLTSLAALDREEGTVSSVVGKISPTSESVGKRGGYIEFSNPIISDPAEVNERISDARRLKDTDPAFSRSNTESVTVSIFDEKSLTIYSDMLAEIRYKKQDIKDQLVALNLTNKVELPQQVIDTLRKNKIIK